MNVALVEWIAAAALLGNLNRSTARWWRWSRGGLDGPSGGGDSTRGGQLIELIELIE